MHPPWQNYRYWVLWRCPTVRFLDYQKVKDAERQKAKELFGSEDGPTELASQVCGSLPLPSAAFHSRSAAKARCGLT